MAARILDGKAVARQIRQELAVEVSALTSAGATPTLAVFLVGTFEPSVIYVRNKEKACAEIGVRTQVFRLAEDTSESDLLEQVRRINDDRSFHAILVQMPLPRQISESAVLAAIDPRKDVDGLTPFNLGRLIAGTPFFTPATPTGIIELLARSSIPVESRHCVIAGRGTLVGKPLAAMLLRKGERGNATVTVCHTRTPDLGRFTRQADILVAAMGSPRQITADMVRPGAVVIDVGTNRLATPAGPRLVGDVDFDAVSAVASAITPVPGGIGPMTIALLLTNTVRAARQWQTPAR